MMTPLIATANYSGSRTELQYNHDPETSTRKRTSSDSTFAELQLSEQACTKKFRLYQYPIFGIVDPQYSSENSRDHRFLFEIGTPNSRDENLLLRMWATWAFILGQYANTHDVLSVVVPGLVFERQKYPSHDVGPAGRSEQIRIPLGRETTILEAIKLLRDGLDQVCWSRSSERQPASNLSGTGDMDTYNLFLSTEDFDESCSELFNSCSILLQCFVFPRRVQAAIYIDRSLTSNQQNQRIIRHFSFLFNSFYKQSPGSSFDSLMRMTPEDIEELRIWNGTVPSYDHSCIDRVIERQASMHPSALAVSACDGEISYRELDTLSSSLAVYLLDRGVTRESHVPICFEKSIYAIVALIAVCKAGGVFVLVDPSQPLHRLKLVIKQLNMKICVLSETQSLQWQSSSETSDLNTIVLRKSLLDSLPERKVPKSLAPQPHHACYVVFTSGSTGEPKGIIIEHRNLVVFCREWQKKLTLRAWPMQSRMLQFASFVFDAAVSEIFLALNAGACICMPSEESRSGGLSDAISSYQVDTAILTPSVLKLLSPNQVPKLKLVVVVGESMTSELIDVWSEASQLINGYGPSECTMGSYANTSITNLTDPSDIGSPVGCVGWIVDSNDSDILLPIGAVGELLIEGPVVGRGYVNNAEKTNSSFIMDPIWIEQFRFSKGNRLYKTGDLVKYAPDGSLLFVGRKDIQVKIRGQRVELSEVEHQIRRAHSDVLDSVADVILPKDCHDRTLLVAFISFKTTKAPSSEDFQSVVDEIEQKMTSSVPKYMIPSVFIPVPRFPLSASGKTDRKALKHMISDKTIQELFSPYEICCDSPELSFEESLVQKWWSEALGLRVESVTRKNSFFRLGGDSIRAIELSRQAKLDGWNLSVTEIFKNPRLSDMAQAIQPIGSSDDSKPKVQESLSAANNGAGECIESLGVFGDNSLISNTEGIMVATDVQEDAIHQSMLPLHAGVLYVRYDMRGQLNIESLRTACLRLTQRHESLRTMFNIRKGQLCQVILSDYDPIFEVRVSEALAVEGSDGLLDTYREDLETFCPLGKPALKLVLIKHSDCYHQLIIRMSHAVIDGLGMERFLTDLRTAYLGLECAPIPSYRDYLEEVSKQYTDSNYEYWKELLKDTEMTELVARIVPDYIHPANSTLSKSVKIQIARAASQDITPATLVKAAWAMVLSKMTGQNDVIFGHLVSGRSVSMPGVMDVVGPCIKDVPMRVKFHPSWTVEEFLFSVQEQYLQSMPYENLGFPEIVRKCTDWPRWTRLSSYVQFQNVQVRSTFSIDEDITGSIQHHEAALDAADFYLMITPCENQFEIGLSFSNDVIPNRVGQEALDRLCVYIKELSKLESGVLDILNADSGVIQLPVRIPSISRRIDGEREWTQNIHQDLTQAWASVLPPGHVAEEPFNLEQNFFDVGGDFPRLVYLVELLRQKGYKMDVNELVYRPLAKTQMALLAEKQAGESKMS